MISVAPHLYRRGKSYYFVIKIPTDIKSNFGNRDHIVKALKTSVLSDAKVAVEPLRAKVKSSFLLIRSGLLTEEQLQKAISELAFRKSVNRKPPEKKLSDIIRMFLDEKTPNIKKRTLRGYEELFTRILSGMGDKEVGTYTRLDAVSFRARMLSEGLKERYCNAHLVHLSSLLKWAVRLSLCKTNFGEGLLLGLSSRQDLERKRLDTIDLNAIFSTIPLNDGDESNVWIPLIALYSGMRREEICQLERSDIRQEEGVWVFDINEKSEKTTKTDAGVRLVPIHSKVLEMGFLEFCSKRAKGAETGNLWGFVRWRESWGKIWGARFNLWYSSVRTDKRKTFHSFRHTVTDELKQAGESKEMVAELIGHAVKDNTFGRYGKRYSVKILRKTIEKLSYNVDLARIDSFIATCG